MSGIYIHVPFCKKACHYCDFHFSTNLKLKSELVGAMIKEIGFQQNYLNEPIQTIYFGGGTPSVLEAEELNNLLDAVRRTFKVDPYPEITLEANPDDLSEKKLQQLIGIGFNRLSIGIQSFDEAYLKKLNRSHTVNQAIKSVANAQKTGFENITIDLIYAIAEDSWDIWKRDIDTALSLNTQHISAYSLTIEEKTVFGNWAKKGKLKVVEDDYSADQFEYLIEELTKNGFDHYEVSNFGKPNYYSQHNTNYWKQIPYLGIGPGAHSFNGNSRQFNVESNPKYIKSIKLRKIPYTLEVLSSTQKINEFILTSIRTNWGCDLGYMKNNYFFDLKEAKQRELIFLQRHQLITIEGNIIKTTQKGIFQADYIAEMLFVDAI